MKVRVAPSIGELERSFEEAWGLETYDPSKDTYEDTVFVGIYGLPDFYTLWRHKGRRWIFWCGSDIRHLQNGYWLDEFGTITIPPKPIAEWIEENCQSWCENYVEYQALRKLGIHSEVSPSFLGDVDAIEVSYKFSERPKLYSSVSGNDFELYGWDKICDVANQYPNIEFHLYGNTVEFRPLLDNINNNVFIHGRVSKEQMNEEIKDMQGAIRLVEFDGFSEIIAKSILMGQWPVSSIAYPHTVPLVEINRLAELDQPNLPGVAYWKRILNRYPWTKK
jgi:hypothetical protein